VNDKKPSKSKEQFQNLWQEAKKGSGWTGADPKDAMAILLSGKKGVACIPNGEREEVRKLADAFSVLAKVGLMGVKMIEIESVDVFHVTEDRFMISGEGVSIAVTAKGNEYVKRFMNSRISKDRKLRLVLSLADFHRDGERDTIRKQEVKNEHRKKRSKRRKRDPKRPPDA
jgi:hypothetical protein